MNADLCIIRGGGDIATGVAWRLTRVGFTVVVTELADPLTVRRTVALSTAVADGEVDVGGLRGVRCESLADAVRTGDHNTVGVVVLPEIPPDHGAFAVVDARLAKRNIDTTIRAASVVVGLGPGFTAGVDCHAVVETNRGHHLGRVIWQGSAEPNTGTPGVVGGRSAERVVRASAAGTVDWDVAIGDVVSVGDRLGTVGADELRAPFDGVIRGAIAHGTRVTAGLKIGDVDPRVDTNCHEISDKALSIGGGVVEAIMWRRRDLTR